MNICLGKKTFTTLLGPTTFLWNGNKSNNKAKLKLVDSKIKLRGKLQYTKHPVIAYYPTLVGCCCV